MTEPLASLERPGTERNRTVATVLDRIERCVRELSLGFERWDDPLARGPGLYLVVATAPVDGFAEPMGANRWPVEDCASVLCDADRLFETARAVAFDRDGAVVVHGDGTIEAEMVRFGQLSATERARAGDLPYAGWMGARHMSALETSTREAVSAVVTLSEEDGRVAVLADGSYEDSRRGAFEERPVRD